MKRNLTRGQKILIAFLSDRLGIRMATLERKALEDPDVCRSYLYFESLGDEIEKRWTEQIDRVLHNSMEQGTIQ